MKYIIATNGLLEAECRKYIVHATPSVMCCDTLSQYYIHSGYKLVSAHKRLTDTGTLTTIQRLHCSHEVAAMALGAAVALGAAMALGAG